VPRLNDLLDNLSRILHIDAILDLYRCYNHTLYLTDFISVLLEYRRAFQDEHVPSTFLVHREEYTASANRKIEKKKCGIKTVFADAIFLINKIRPGICYSPLWNPKVDTCTRDFF